MLLRLVPILLLAAARVWSQSPAIPDTPAGHTLQAWLDAFNSGVRARIQAYETKYEPTKSRDETDATVAFRNFIGGFDLLGVDKSDRLHVEFRVKEKSGAMLVVVGKLEVKDGDPATVVHFSLRPIPPGATAADMSMKIDPVTRGRVIDGAVAGLNELYVYPETAKKMEEALRARQKKGEYDAVEDAAAFAELLTQHLQQVSHDKHLRVDFSPAVLPKDLGARDPGADTRMRTQMERDNCLFHKAERLPSNIGYLKFNGFPPPEVCGPTAIAAMNFLGNVDAIIFDLRENGGGDPKMVALILTYLFDQPTHLNDIYNRKEDATTQFWTLPYVPGKRLAGKPVFVLTAKYTFSAAEEFAYNLKNLKRGTIIGETTGGGAHPVSGYRIDDHFMVVVPSARSVSPISKTNWEGTGVEPDIKVPADQALDVAKEKAAEQIRNDAANKQ
ncbi:MAG TPA: S41 family peptidase [Gemmatimonadales bacterium]|nr:S41 family peptidase [Gemmatimonadales bacterium]